MREVGRRGGEPSHFKALVSTEPVKARPIFFLIFLFFFLFQSPAIDAEHFIFPFAAISIFLLTSFQYLCLVFHSCRLCLRARLTS